MAQLETIHVNWNHFKINSNMADWLMFVCCNGQEEKQSDSEMCDLLATVQFS